MTRLHAGAACRHVAASKGCYALAKWLIKKQHVDVNPIDQDGRTPLAVCEACHMCLSAMACIDVPSRTCAAATSTQRSAPFLRLATPGMVEQVYGACRML